MNNLAATGGVPGPGRIGRVAIGDLLKRAARRFPDRIALTDGARRVTFTELERDANRFANYLVKRGLKPGEKISTICNNSVEFVKALFGIHRAGLVWVPINTMLGPADMDYILDHAEVRFALIDDNLHAQADRRAALEKRGMEMIAIDLTGKVAATGLENFNDLIKGQSDIEPEIEFDDRDLAMIIYTSGTTSRPKGAMHCHLAVVMAVMSNCHRDAARPRRRHHRAISAVPLRRPRAAAELSFGRRPDGADARLRSRGLHGSHRARQAHGLCRPVADVSGDPRSSAPQGVRSFGPADLHLHHGADGPAAAGARDGRHVPEFRADQRPDRNVSGHHDVAAGPCSSSASAITGANR